MQMKGVRIVMMIDVLRHRQVDTAELDALVELLVFGEAYAAKYAEYGEVPEWIPVAVDEVKRELKTRIDDERQRQIRETKAQIANLRTAAEKRAALEERLAKLEGKS